MIRDQSESLRKSWKEAGKGKCLHPVLSLEITRDNYFTGVYFCLGCGAETVVPFPMSSTGAPEASSVEVKDAL